MLDVDAVRMLLSGKSKLSAYVGRYVGNEGMLALVDLGDQRVPVPFLTGLEPQINEAVHVWSLDGSPFMVGPTAPKPSTGIVLTITGNQAVVRTDFGDHPMVVAPSDPMPTSGETVGIVWGRTPWCQLLIDVPEPPPPPPNPGGGTSQAQTATFVAREAGSTDRDRSRWWTDRPMASESTYGAWMYGSAIKDTVPAGAQLEYVQGVPQLQVWVSWARRRYPGPPRWVMHNLYGKTAVPAVSAFTGWDPTQTGWHTPPNAQAIFDGLKAGGPWAGLGFDRGGWEEAKSLREDGMSGAIKITWR